MAKKILAVDDSKTMRDMVTFTLSKAGFDVMEAADGQKALDVMRRTKFDLIITDINMPIMDGITLIKNVRKLPAMKAKPILMLTTEGLATKKEEGKAAGATGWIIKPFDPDKLLQTIAKVLP